MKKTRLLSLIILMFTLISFIPFDGYIALAQGGKLIITEIKITKHIKEFGNKDKAYYSILIMGNLDSLDGMGVAVKKESEDGRLILATQNPEIKNEYIAPASDEYENKIYIVKNGTALDSIDVFLPDVTSIEPSDGIVMTDDTGNDIELNITGVDENEEVKGSLYQGSSKIPFELSSEVKIENENLKVKIENENLKDKTGSWGLEFKKKEYKKELSSANFQGETNINISARYDNVFSLRKKLDVSEDIKMFPTQGPRETEVTLQAEKIHENISIFLLKDKTDRFTKDNMVDNSSIRLSKEIIDGKKEILFTIPKSISDIGSYYVVLTNRIEPEGNIDKKITQFKIIEDPRFTIIDAENSLKINSLNPDKGPSTGTNATIRGMNIAKVSKDLYLTDSEAEQTIEVDGLRVEYKGGKYNGEDVEELIRNIKIIVGGPVKFLKKADIGSVYDDFYITIPENNNLDNPVKDVVVEVETKIIYKDGKEVKYSERDILKDGFTYYEVDFKPVIKDIQPNKIPVDDSFNVTEDIVISITGENFLKHKYIYQDPKDPEKNEIRTKLPEIDLPNHDDSSEWFEDLEVYNENGNIIDGEQEFLGSRIITTIKKGSKIPEGIIGNIVDLRVTNPIKVNDQSQMGSSATGKIQFVKVSEDKTPVIVDINPYIIPTEGEKDIVITGDKFLPGVRLYINGEEIKNIKRDDTGKKINFDAPARREGQYQILVQNEEGGVATFDEFTYVKAYTNIKINDFNPKKGTKDTLVTIKGESFLPPNPLVKDLSGNGIDKLIGTKVLLDGKDINSYNKDSEGNISLINYESKSDNLVISALSGNVILSDYYNSIIFKSEEDGSYFNLVNDLKAGKILLRDGNKYEYELIARDDRLIAIDKNGGEKEFKVTNKSIEVDNKKMIMQTVYSVNQENEIVGNRVKVIDNNEIEFKVPKKSPTGYYDITVVNPDTKKDSKIGNNGFYYYEQPDYNPEILEIYPNEGEINGGYFVDIIGSGFVFNNEVDKSIVIINGEQVDSKDVIISKDGGKITFKVPKFKGTINSDVSRRPVSVVVVNPDGGSASLENGFTYVVAKSNPEIVSIIEKSGAVTTDDVLVSIEGNDFRFYEPFYSRDGDAEYKEGDPYTDLNADKEWTDLRGKKMEDLSAEDKKILPKVYFGTSQAEVVEFSAGVLLVKPPKGNIGTVKVYIVNNDYGKSNEVDYTYEASNLSINKVVPSVGRKQGDEYIELHGMNFLEDRAIVYTSSTDRIEKNNFISVQFGETTDTNISNSKFTNINDINTGNFVNNATREIKVGNLTAKYSKGKLELKIVEKEDGEDIEYKEVFDYDLEEAYIPVKLLKDKNSRNYPGYELIKFSEENLPGASTTTRLRIDRAFSQDARILSASTIGLKTPSFYKIGKTQLTVTNPDKMSAKGEFEFTNPDSKPVITNLYKNNDESLNIVDEDRSIVPVGIKSDTKMYVKGSGFRKGLTISIGDIEIKDPNINYQLKDDKDEYGQLTFSLKDLPENVFGREDYIVVTNPDKGVGNSIPYYIRFTRPETTSMKVTGLVPNFGPSSGGTESIIHGEDFRKTMDGYDEELKVYFDKGDQREEAEIIKVEHNKIYIKTPPFKPGKADVIVENPDGNSIKLIDGFTYMSSPTITNVVDPKNDKRKIETISLNGGEKIKIKGTDFMTGAKVVFNPKLREVKDDQAVTGDVITIGNKKYVLESGYTVDGEAVEYIDEQNLIVTTPEGKNGDKGVIVVNLDNGATNVYDLIFGIPEIGAPMDVYAEVVHDEFIRVTWDGVTAAREYEIYMSEDGKAFEYIGSTELTSFVVNKLKPRTDYQFLVRAMGQYGVSKPIDESKSNTVTTGRTIGPKDKDGPIGDRTEIKKHGNRLDIVLGREEFDSRGLLIDLTRGELIGVEDVTIRIPANIITSYKGDVSIRAKDYSMKFNPSVFTNTSMINNRDNPNAGVVFKVNKYRDNPNVPVGETIVSGVYSIEANNYIDNTNSKIDRIAGSIFFNLDQDFMKVNSRRLNNIRFSRYDNGSWNLENSVNRMGLYTLIGSRR